MKKTIYVVDDEPLQLRYLEAALRKGDFEVRSFSDPIDLLDAVESHLPDAAVIDLVMPRMSGIELIGELRKRSARIPLIAVTAYSEVESAINAVRAGANDYLRKPFLPSELHLVLERLLTSTQLRDNLDLLLGANASVYSIEALVGDSSAITSMRNELLRLARLSDANVIISGENGTGKSFAARILHYSHATALQRFISINCATTGLEELEADLFGAVDIRSDGTRARHSSVFDVADGGTVLLENLSDMARPTQKKLYDAFVASATGDRVYPFRIIATTTIDLSSEDAFVAFDPELFNYLSPYHLAMPSLRDRTEDVIPIAEHLVRASDAYPSVRIQGLTQAAKDALRSYEWPGNLRELHSVIERALVTAQTQLIDEQDLRLGHAGQGHLRTTDDAGAPASLKDVEIEQIRRVLAYTQGDLTEAARILGISRKSLWERRKRYSID